MVFCDCPNYDNVREGVGWWSGRVSWKQKMRFPLRDTHGCRSIDENKQMSFNQVCGIGRPAKKNPAKECTSILIVKYQFIFTTKKEDYTFFCDTFLLLCNGNETRFSELNGVMVYNRAYTNPFVYYVRGLIFFLQLLFLLILHKHNAIDFLDRAQSQEPTFYIAGGM